MLTRDDAGLGPVGHRFRNRRPSGYPHPRPHSAFKALRLHHTVSAARDVDRDGAIAGDLGDLAAFMRELQVARPDLGLEVPYSFVVAPGPTPDVGVVCEGRGFGRVGAHTAGQNSSTYGVALVGNRSKIQVSPGELAAVRWVGHRLADPVAAGPTLGHRDLKATECPGDFAYARLGELQPPFIDPAPEVPDVNVPRPTDTTRVVTAHDGKGYYRLAADGSVYAESGAHFFGSFPGLPPEARQLEPDEFFVDLLPIPGGYVLFTNRGDRYGFPY